MRTIVVSIFDGKERIYEDDSIYKISRATPYLSTKTIRKYQTKSHLLHIFLLMCPINYVFYYFAENVLDLKLA